MGEKRHLEIATGGDPEKAFLAAVTRLPIRGGMLSTVAVSHDDGCPCTEGAPKDISHCTCEVVFLDWEEVLL